MTDYSTFDDQMRNRLGSLEPDVPAHIWENIQRRKEHRRPVAWWWPASAPGILIWGIALLLGGLGIYQLADRTTADQQLEPQQTVSLADKNNQSGNQQAGPVTQGTNEETPNGTTTPSGRDQLSPGLPSNNGKGNKGGGNLPGHSSNDITGNPSELGNGNMMPPVSPAQTTTDSRIVTNTGRSQRKKSRTQMSVQTDTPVETGVDESIAGKPDGSRLSANEKISGGLTAFVLSPETDHILFEGSPGLRPLKFTARDLAPVPCAEKNAAGNKKYVEVYGGPDYVLRSFADTANSEYLRRRKESTKYSSAFSFGMRYTRVFSNGMSFRAGLNYSQVNEKFTYSEGNIVQQVFIINANGDTTGAYSYTGTRYKTTMNRYRTIDVPVTIGYELGNERLHANINAGVVFNVYSWQKGDVLDTAYRPVSITTGKSGASPYGFKTNIGLGFIGAASIYYKLNDRYRLMAEPFIRYNFSAANKADITLKQKFTTIGLRLGLRIDF